MADRPSLTYLDSGGFGGRLYLDEKNHDFYIKLPSSYSRSWTLSFRFYSSYSEASNIVKGDCSTDIISTSDCPVNYIRASTTTYSKSSYQKSGYTAYYFDYIGPYHTLLTWDNSEILYLNANHSTSSPIYFAINGTSSKVKFLGTPLSTGSWNEFCLVQNGYSLYFYLNGLKVGTSTADSYYSLSTLSFHLADDVFSQSFDDMDKKIRLLTQNHSAVKKSSVPLLPDRILCRYCGKCPANSR